MSINTYFAYYLYYILYFTIKQARENIKIIRKRKYINSIPWKKFVYKWIHVIQTHVIRGPTTDIFALTLTVDSQAAKLCLHFGFGGGIQVNQVTIGSWQDLSVSHLYASMTATP